MNTRDWDGGSWWVPNLIPATAAAAGLAAILILTTRRPR